MIIMNLELDNILGFEDFKINFSYPKKIVNTSIPFEYLEEKPNFRFKRVNIIMGANASGKTSLGRVMKGIFNFIDTKVINSITPLIANNQKDASFKIDLVSKGEYLWNIECIFFDKALKTLIIKKCKINKTDNYEKCKEKLEIIYEEFNINNNLNFLEGLEKIDIKDLHWGFSFPDTSVRGHLISNKLLDIVLRTLDPSIESIRESNEAKNTFLISFKNSDEKIIIQDGEIVNKNRLSSGTLEGISIARSLSAINASREGIHYIDENFSYIQSDVEIAIFNLMIEMLGKKSQLFFTTHNMELLDMNLPIHSFLFLKKSDKITTVKPESIIKRNNQSLKNAVENDVFGTIPNTFLLEEYTSELMTDE